MIFAIVMTWHLVLMPLAGEPGPSGVPSKTEANKDLFKPFDTGKTFDTEELCQAEGKARMSEYLRERGLPEGTIANMGCTRQ